MKSAKLSKSAKLYPIETIPESESLNCASEQIRPRINKNNNTRGVLERVSSIHGHDSSTFYDDHIEADCHEDGLKISSNPESNHILDDVRTSSIESQPNHPELEQSNSIHSDGSSIFYDTNTQPNSPELHLLHEQINPNSVNKGNVPSNEKENISHKIENEPDNKDNKSKESWASVKQKIFTNSKRPADHTRLSSLRDDPRNRSTSCNWKWDKFDPFQVFEVLHEVCLDFTITIHNGEKITKGNALMDLMDTPDPYVLLKVPGSSHPTMRTVQVDNNIQPNWEETFHFYLDPTRDYTLNVTLMDANYTVDETLGVSTFRVNDLKHDTPLSHTFTFPGGSKVHATLFIAKNKQPDLRFSLVLCEEEQIFLQMRRRNCLLAMMRLLGDRAPSNDKQVPIVAVLGSGGGFRAMMAMSGVTKALNSTGLFDCVTYVCGLSGSSWYISNLYAHEGFPDVSAEVIHEEMRQAVTSGWRRRLPNLLSYVPSLLDKYFKGLPVSFTDIFGHLLGDVLLMERKNTLLSDQAKCLVTGSVPFPLYTCLHAKLDVSCKKFSEWMEFSPYEIGIAKYGTFMKTKHFGSKFIMGKLIKEHPEMPLHYLQGVWGSAFAILLKRLVMREGLKNKDMVQIMRENVTTERALNEQYDEARAEQSVESDTDDEEDVVGKDDEVDGMDIILESESGDQVNNKRLSRDEEPIILLKQLSLDEIPKKRKSIGEIVLGKLNNDNKSESAPGLLSVLTQRKVSKDKPKLSAEMGESIEKSPSVLRRSGAMKRGPSLNPMRRSSQGSNISMGTTVSSQGTTNVWRERRRTLRKKRLDANEGLLQNVKNKMLMGSNFLNDRCLRAGAILNPFRGLSLRNSFPISPFTEQVLQHPTVEEDEMDLERSGLGSCCRYEPLDNKAKKLYIVDSGLAFNSPYPILLRPQRAVDVYLSFDFSQRETDKHLPFQELLIAETWARQNKVPFPPVQNQIKQYLDDGFVREVYVFKNEDDPACPVILHFPIVNQSFRTYKAPGVLREVDEVDFADFPIFDDPNNIYSSQNFLYDEIHFERMVQLMEYNTLNCLEVIKDAIAEAVVRKKEKIMRKQSMPGLGYVSDMLTHLSNLTRQSSTELRITIKPEQEKNLLKYMKRRATLSSCSDYEDSVED